MIIKKDVLIYRGYKNATGVKIIKSLIPLFFNFDQNKKIGTATIREENGSVYADLKISDFTSKHLLNTRVWPALGGDYEDGLPFVIKSAAICSEPNIDPEISPITSFQYV